MKSTNWTAVAHTKYNVINGRSRELETSAESHDEVRHTFKQTTYNVFRHCAPYKINIVSTLMNMYSQWKIKRWRKKKQHNVVHTFNRDVLRPYIPNDYLITHTIEYVCTYVCVCVWVPLHCAFPMPMMELKLKKKHTQNKRSNSIVSGCCLFTMQTKRIDGKTEMADKDHKKTTTTSHCRPNEFAKLLACVGFIESENAHFLDDDHKRRRSVWNVYIDILILFNGWFFFFFLE